MKIPTHFLYHLTTVFVALVSAPAVGQTVSSDNTPAVTVADGKRTFRPEFFAAFSPISAFDMVKRIPGFSIIEGDGRRGFGENAGNVLIDGDRPSTKSDDIGTILARIPASQVAYIVLNEQAGSNADARGQGQVVDVVRKIADALTGKYEVDLEIGERRGATPFGDVSATLRRGPTTVELSGYYFAQLNHTGGLETVRDGRGVVTELRRDTGRALYNDADISAAIKTRIAGAKLNLNGKLHWERAFTNRTTALFDDAATPTGTETIADFGPRSNVAIEIGGDIAFPLIHTLGTKIVALDKTEKSVGNGSVGTFPVVGSAGRFDTDYANRPSETILRVQNDWSAIAGHAIQFGGEVAFNRLEARFSAASTSGGVITQFPASNVVISERRFEPFVSDVWTIDPRWTVEAGVIVEASQLTLSGDATARRRFVFAKPRLVATWAAGPHTNFEFRAERQVAQLDFGDFATSVDLGAGAQVSAGNADLVPEKTLTVSAQVRRSFFERGSIQLTGRYARVTDTQDLVPIVVRDASGAITSRFDGAGNIGNSTRWSGALEITLPFDWLTKSLGLTGLELQYTGNYNNSRVIDPVTGRFRRRSGVSLWDQNFDFHQDLPKAGISWGTQIYVLSPSVDYFVDQIRTGAVGAEIFAYVEYKKWSPGTIRFQIANLTDVALRRTRIFFRDSRATDDVRSFVRDRSRDTRFQLSFSGKF